MVNELRDLVNSFVSDPGDYARFRDQFVTRFLALHHEDALLETLVNAIDALCADFDEGDIASTTELKEELKSAVSLPLISIEIIDEHGALRRQSVSPPTGQTESGSGATFLWRNHDLALT
jgi:hypothetical protein